jgi:hypothetical protein
MSANPQRYAARVLARYQELGLTTDAKISAAKGVSTSTLTAYRNARDKGEHLPEPRDDTFGKIDESCRWKPGSARTLWEGGEPTPVGGAMHDAESGDTLLYRRPPGLSDLEWDRLRQSTRDFIQWQIDQAARER